jgi:hypothetical protein
VWTYGTGLELNSPRFNQPGDFFTYVVFVTVVILVSLLLGRHVVTFLTLALLSLISVSSLTHLEYLPAQSLLAEAVPEKRKITPCGTHIHVIRKSVKVSVCGVGMVGAQLRNACATIPVAVSGCGFLHIYRSSALLLLATCLQIRWRSWLRWSFSTNG